MNQAERQALREKHAKCDHCGLCDGCPSEYPCDVIKYIDAVELHKALLEATEPVSETDPKLSEFPACDQDHPAWQKFFPYFVYCPKCGEKL